MKPSNERRIRVGGIVVGRDRVMDVKRCAGNFLVSASEMPSISYLGHFSMVKEPMSSDRWVLDLISAVNNSRMIRDADKRVQIPQCGYDMATSNVSALLYLVMTPPKIQFTL